MIDTVRLRVLLVALSGWVNRHQLDVIEYLRKENRVLKKHLGARRLKLPDAQRRRLAATGGRLVFADSTSAERQRPTGRSPHKRGVHIIAVMWSAT